MIRVSPVWAGIGRAGCAGGRGSWIRAEPHSRDTGFLVLLDPCRFSASSPSTAFVIAWPPRCSSRETVCPTPLSMISKRRCTVRRCRSTGLAVTGSDRTVWLPRRPRRRIAMLSADEPAPVGTDVTTMDTVFSSLEPATGDYVPLPGRARTAGLLQGRRRDRDFCHGTGYRSHPFRCVLVAHSPVRSRSAAGNVSTHRWFHLS